MLDGLVPPKGKNVCYGVPAVALAQGNGLQHKVGFLRRGHNVNVAQAAKGRSKGTLKDPCAIGDIEGDLEVLRNERDWGSEKSCRKHYRWSAHGGLVAVTGSCTAR
jgi:hypothetical protein